MLKTEEKRLLHDISSISKSLEKIAKDLHYFREKDEAAAVVEDEAAAVVEDEEESKYTCKDCAAYILIDSIDSTCPMHLCTVHTCSISEDGLKDICDNFVKDGEF